MRYHINPATGEPGPCRAQAGGCPFGGPDAHYDDAQQARQAYEASQPALTSGLKKATPTAGEQEMERFFQASVNDYAHEIELADHSVPYTHYISLDETQQRAKALNNCWAASVQLLEEFSPHELQEAGIAHAELKTVIFEDDSPHHALLVTTQGGERIVVDYTARQYAESDEEEARIPWPVVKEEQAWQAYVASMAKKRWGLALRANQEPPTPRGLQDQLKEKFEGVEISLSERSGGFVVLDRIVVRDQKRGTGSQVLEELVAVADREGWKLALTPSTDFGATSRARLEKFYRRFGFVPNKGRSKDFTTMEAMLRLPSGSTAR